MTARRPPCALDMRSRHALSNTTNVVDFVIVAAEHLSMGVSADTASLVALTGLAGLFLALHGFLNRPSTAPMRLVCVGPSRAGCGRRAELFGADPHEIKTKFS